MTTVVLWYGMVCGVGMWCVGMWGVVCGMVQFTFCANLSLPQCPGVWSFEDLYPNATCKEGVTPWVEKNVTDGQVYYYFLCMSLCALLHT